MSFPTGPSSTSQPGHKPEQQVDELPYFNRSAGLRLLEKLALFIERPFNWIGTASLNLFYHTDTLAVFLWLVVGLSGLYLTLFYQFDFDAAYRSVAKMESQVIAHIIRAIHRYATDSAILVTVLHGIRLFFMARFRGARWLAWVSGIVMAILLLVDGLTGYWLIWDTRAQLITNSFTAFLNKFTPFGPAFISGILTTRNTSQGWIFITILLLLHILLFGVGALFFWWHIMRLNRPRFLPARYWLIGVGAVLVIVAAVFPLGMLPKADFSQLPPPVSLDPFYLAFVPFGMSPYAGWFLAGFGILSIALALLPWLSFSKPAPPIRIDEQKCTGCTLCSRDCPYKAIEMQELPAGARHKFMAQVDQKMCVACGVCLGSCEFDAISLTEISAPAIWQRVEAGLARHPNQPVTVCFTCERHAAHGARPYLAQQPASLASLEVIPLPCVAVIPPKLVGRTLSSGAAEVRVVGCPPDDCSRREGNLWTDARLSRERLPRLKKAFENAPVYTFWLAPDAFSQALPEPSDSPENNRPGSTYIPQLTWRHFGLAFGVLAILMAVQIGISRAWAPRIYPAAQAKLQLVIPNPSILVYPAERFVEKFASQPARLMLLEDETVLFQHPFPFSGQELEIPLVVDHPVNAGTHTLLLSLVDEAVPPHILPLYQASLDLKPSQVWLLILNTPSRPK
jgi:ferredoxin/quinol-cytochrome oxidoreductase complex cytochrome b subunit